ncbi:hypothetical protein NDU88_005619 [Pleurodeles waltl]|uniref:Uncharacterized protein n=1 Tax=Pleurodeles waltl TaxID=8319 RepID=A0AAV7QFS6_PLEWA|nr:hypothetical protein NDU88_005619 [Pleurodeles waltl]
MSGKPIRRLPSQSEEETAGPLRPLISPTGHTWDTSAELQHVSGKEQKGTLKDMLSKPLDGQERGLPPPVRQGMPPEDEDSEGPIICCFLETFFASLRDDL